MATGRHRGVIVTRRQAVLYVVAAVLLALVGGALGGHYLTPERPSAATFSVPGDVAARPPAFPGMAVSFTGSGKFRVPEQAPPGEYAVTSTSGTFGCSWWILKADDGKPKSEISAGTFNRAGFDTLTIPASARWLKLLGDCTLRAAS